MTQNQKIAEHLQNVGSISWVEANDLFEQIGCLIDIAIEYQCVGQIHHVAGLAWRLLIRPGKKGLGGLIFAQLVEHGAGEVQYCWVRGLNAAHLF